MSSQLYLAQGIVVGRVHTGRDLAQQRSAELALEADRTATRSARRAVRRARRRS